MHPELFTFPGGFNVKTYGFCLMIGFLSAVWLAMRRATKVGADPDRVLDISFLCLLFGVGGARAFFVIHYWTPQFSDAPSRFWAIVNITEGGLEFLGGFLGATLAVTAWGVIRKQSLRLYLDIMAPGAMWGLALGRVGCFFNGCCFGGPCELPQQQPQFAWAVRFPYASPAQWREWEDRKVTLPAELVSTWKEDLQPRLIPDSVLFMPVEKREGPRRKLADLKIALDKAKAEGSDSPEAKNLATQFASQLKATETSELEQRSIRRAQKFPSRIEPTRATSISELEDIAARYRSLYVHPAQLYAAIGAMLLSLFLSALYYVRKRHGVVIGALLVMYPVQRMFEEMIREDNPKDVGGLTVSQFVSLGLFFMGAAYLHMLYRRMPERSPLADAAAPPPMPT